jgi:glycosyltransferase involved in cell wall biosynthesis
MRVLVLQSELGVLRGGGENFTRNLFAAFARLGHEVAAAFVARPGGTYPIALPAGIEPLPLPGWWSRDLGQATLSMTGRCFPEQTSLRRFWGRVQQGVTNRVCRWHDRRFHWRVEREFAARWPEFDAVYVHGNPLVAYGAARRRPTVLRLPGPVTSELEPALRGIHAVCANGDALSRIREFLGDHALELPVGIDATLFKPEGISARSAARWRAEDRVIGYVGRLTHLKGVDLLAAAFCEIHRKLPRTRLLIIGDGKERSRIRSILAREIATGAARMEPDIPHDELSAWYRAIDLMVMPSRYENYSNALLEAMSCGVPFVASDVGGNRKLAESGAGWLFDCQSVRSLAAALTAALSSPEELRVRAIAGSRFVRRRYSWEASAARLEWIIASRLGVAVGHEQDRRACR